MKSVAVAVFVLLAWTPRAQAGGFYLLERGTRTLGRGGAHVAGADDGNALWMNPAGLSLAGTSLDVDATLSVLTVNFARSGDYPAVSSTSEPIPIPSVTATWQLNREWSLGGGVLAPNAGLNNWPEQSGNGPAPQRYSALRMDGTWLAMPTLGVAFRPIPEWSIGLAGHLVLGQFAPSLAVSTCDGVTCSYPEDDRYDVIARAALPVTATPALGLGTTLHLHPFRFAISATTPFTLGGRARLEARLPAAVIFDGAFMRSRAGACGQVSDAEVAGDANHACRAVEGGLSIPLPLVLRAGVEWQADAALRIEISGVYETWSSQRDLSIVPDNAWLVNAVGGVLDYQFGVIQLPRMMQDTLSLRAGSEWQVVSDFSLRGGLSWESAAFSDRTVSVLTPDGEKVSVALGATWTFLRDDNMSLQLDALIGYAHVFSRDVRTSVLTQVRPVRPSLSEQVIVGNGRYDFTLPFFGIGLRALFPEVVHR